MVGATKNTSETISVKRSSKTISPKTTQHSQPTCPIYRTTPIEP